MRFLTGSRKARLLLGLATVAAVSASLSAAIGSAAPEASTLSVKIRNYALDLSSHSLPAGRTRIKVAVAGGGGHAILVARLKAGVTAARFTQSLNTKDGLASFSLASFRGGIDELTPGREWQMITDLVPGRYVLADHSWNGDKPNYDRGAIATFRVTADVQRPAAAPKPKGSIIMDDFAFRIHLARSFHGHGWVKIENRGAAIHRIILLRLNPGVSFAKAYKAVHARAHGSQAPPPGRPIELITAVAPGFAGYLNVNLKPGRYVAACFHRDSQTRFVSHTELGMIGHFTIS